MKQLGVYLYLVYYFARLVLSNALVVLIVSSILFLVAQFLYPINIISTNGIASWFNVQDVEIKAAILSSSITIFGIFLTVMFASAQWKKDTNAKRKIDIAGNLVSIMHDFHFLVTEIRIFAEYTKYIIITADQLGFDQINNQYEYWKKRRRETTEIEEKLWRLWHEYNRWTAIGKTPLTALGLSSITDKVSAIVSHAKIQSTKVDLYCPEQGYPNLDFVLEHFDLYCLDELVEQCEKDAAFIAANASVLNDTLLMSLKEYTFREFVFIIKMSSEIEEFVHLLKTGDHKGLKKLKRAYMSSQLKR